MFGGSFRGSIQSSGIHFLCPLIYCLKQMLLNLMEYYGKFLRMDEVNLPDHLLQSYDPL